MAEVNPRSKRDEILFTILKAGLEGKPYADLNHLIGTHSQQIKELKEALQYIKHHGGGCWSLTRAGELSLQARYRNIPKTADFDIGEVKR